MATIAEILLSQGRSIADARRQSGDRSARLAQNLAGIASDTIGGYFQQKQDQPYRDAQIADIQARTDERNMAMQDRAQKRDDLAELGMAQTSGLPPEQIEQQLQARGRPDLAGKYTDWQTARTQLVKDRRAANQQAEVAGQKYAAFLAQDILQKGPQGPSGYLSVALERIQDAVKDDMLSQEDGEKLAQSLNQAPERIPGILQEIIKNASPQAKVGTQQIKTRNADGSETTRLVEDRPGQEFTSAPPPVEEKPDARSLEVQLADAKMRGDRGRVDAIEYAIRQGANLSRAPVTGNGDPGPLETVVGADGVTRYTTRRDAVGQRPGSGTQKPASGLEKRALNFFNRAKQADEELEALEPQIQQMGLMDQGRMQYAPNVAQSQLGQSYIAAQRAFTEARLRKDSGAAIPPQEFENDRQTYFAQPGDSQETLEQKRRARATMLASLGFESGQALGEFVGDPTEAKAIVDGYKARSAKPAQKAPGAAPAKAPAAGGWVEIAPGVRVREKR